LGEQGEVASQYAEVGKLAVAAEWSLVATLRELALMDAIPRVE